jgi:hypothetical protein
MLGRPLSGLLHLVGASSALISSSFGTSPPPNVSRGATEGPPLLAPGPPATAKGSAVELPPATIASAAAAAALCCAAKGAVADAGIGVGRLIDACPADGCPPVRRPLPALGSVGISGNLRAECAMP